MTPLPEFPGTIVKVCGLRNAQDVSFCLETGVNMLGFIFHPQSPRHVEPDVVAKLPTGQALRVGVFVRQSPDEVLEIMTRARLDLAQLHGGQDGTFCVRVDPSRIIKVMWPSRYTDRTNFEADLRRFAPLCRHYLFESGKSGGGHGQSFDLSLVQGVNSPRPWFLAGGLGPDNVGPALSRVRPSGVDLNSGVEISPGVKDPDKILRCLGIIRKYDEMTRP